MHSLQGDIAGQGQIGRVRAVQGLGFLGGQG